MTFNTIEIEWIILYSEDLIFSTYGLFYEESDTHDNLHLYNPIET